MPLDRVRGQPLFDALVDRADGRWGRLRYRPSLVLILLTSLVALVPLAHASPPDPLWIAGAYDGDDLDEVVVAATSLESRVEGCLLVVSPVTMVAYILRVARVRIPTATALSSAHSRAPPKP